MTAPSIDILVPVWNSPFETRACLSAILGHSPGTRLIIVDYGSSRETELMLEEFSDSLEERGLFIKSDQNIGLVPAINRGLECSDRDFTVILRQQTMVSAGWLDALMAVADEDPWIGLVSPVFSGSGASPRCTINNRRDCSSIETFTVSFSSLLLRREMLLQTGLFDEEMDSDEWCLTDYLRRAWSKGYRSCVSSHSRLECSQETVFGSPERRQSRICASRERYLERWGEIRHYGVYFGADTEADQLGIAMDTILEGARQGHRFTLLLHHRQTREFRRRGWSCLHTGIELARLSLLMPQRDLQRKLEALRKSIPGITMVRWQDEASVVGMEEAVPFQDMADVVRSDYQAVEERLRHETQTS